jgi:hypothetical protein
MPWRSRVSVSRRRLLPVGFIVPCQPTLVEQPPEGSLWLHEIKYDGFRMLARLGEGRARLWSRNALEWTGRLPRIVQSLEDLPVASAVLDGEAVTEDHLGRPDFHGLRSVAGLRSAGGRTTCMRPLAPTLVSYRLGVEAHIPANLSVLNVENVNPVIVVIARAGSADRALLASNDRYGVLSLNELTRFKRLEV